jgi:hypothetical protein
MESILRRLAQKNKYLKVTDHDQLGSLGISECMKAAYEDDDAAGRSQSAESIEDALTAPVQRVDAHDRKALPLNERRSNGRRVITHKR